MKEEEEGKGGEEVEKGKERRVGDGRGEVRVKEK
jgi:hypothetical protein